MVIFNLSYPLSISLTLVALVSVLGVGDAKDFGGFSVELIHRDSPKSPFYNPSLTNPQRVSDALRRSLPRAHRFAKKANGVTTNTPQAPITNGQGEYIMNISIGTPPFQIVAIADTGSDLIWTQCKPCETCFKQDYPLFSPKNSSSYKLVPCASRQCQDAAGRSSTCSGGSCTYSVTYGDQSYSNGDIATDTLVLGSTSGRPVAFPKTLIGCGHDNNGTFNELTSGIIGLGGGKASLVTQIGSSIGGKFSYCLVPLQKANGKSKLNFGSNGIVSGGGAVSTPLVKSGPDTFYFLQLEAISVDGEKIDFPVESSFGFGDPGNIIIDSGTTLTLVPSDFYSSLEAAVENGTKGRRVEDPSGFLNLCYESGSGLELPELVVHFKGADVKLNDFNFFVEIAEGISCFSFAPFENGAIYGNLAQANFLVGYDSVEGTVSFKPTDCSKH